jgi:hypothetical protein
MKIELEQNSSVLIIKEKLFVTPDIDILEEYVIKNEPKIKIQKQKKTRYYPNPNPNPTNTLQVVMETDEELFNNLFDVNQIYRINRYKKYTMFCIFLGIYALMGYMYYKYIYIH